MADTVPSGAAPNTDPHRHVDTRRTFQEALSSGNGKAYSLKLGAMIATLVEHKFGIGLVLTTNSLKYAFIMGGTFDLVVTVLPISPFFMCGNS